MTQQTYNRFGSFVECIFNAVNGSHNSLGAGDFAVFDWNIEINTENDFLKIDKIAK